MTEDAFEHTIYNLTIALFTGGRMDGVMNTIPPLSMKKKLV